MPQSPFTQAQAVTPSDTVDLPRWTLNKQLTDAIYIGVLGNISLVFPDNSTVTLVGIQSGEILYDVGVRRINFAGTTATGIVVFYRGA